MRTKTALAITSLTILGTILTGGIGLAAEPASVSAPVYRPGDTWIYERAHEEGRSGFKQERMIESVERVDSTSLLLGLKLDGSQAGFEDHLVGLDLSERRITNGQSVVTERPLSFPLKIGATWQEDFVDPRRQGVQTSAHVLKTYKVLGWEDVTVQAGTFHALKIEATGTLTVNVILPATASSAAMASPSGAASISQVARARAGTITQSTYRLLYYAPEVKSYVKTVYEQYNSENVRVKRDTSTLSSFKAGS